MAVHLSTSLFTDRNKHVLEDNDLIIPLFIAKLISFLTYIRKSNGDLHIFQVETLTNFEEFIQHCKKLEKFLGDLDWTTLIPTLNTRYSTRPGAIKIEISAFFTRIYACNDLDGVTILFLNELSMIEKAAREIVGTSVHSLFVMIWVNGHDSKPLAHKLYVSFCPNFISFPQGTEINSLHMFMSHVFHGKTIRLFEGKQILLLPPFVHDDVVSVDTTSSYALTTMIAFIVANLAKGAAAPKFSKPGFSNKKPSFNKKEI
jgi:hypothetical protein